MWPVGYGPIRGLAPVERFGLPTVTSTVQLEGLVIGHEICSLRHSLKWLMIAILA